MKFARLLIPAVLMAAGVVALAPRAPSQDQPEQPQPQQQQGVDVMARGPVHEAFAEPTAAKPEAGPVVPKQPPELITEEPPEQKPEGDNIEWISGYWGWDDDSNDFLWVSGFWREAPPGRAWVAGYWHQVQGGWQWSPGFWSAADAQEVTYVPPPPDPVETGPSTPAPEADMVYSPGSWVWRETRFLWRPGFWVEFRPGWVWIPAHYIWTPAGFVFIDGYWDYPLADRGLLFAPCRFHREVLVRTFRFVPFYVIQPDFLISALFVSPRRHRYYFGDYFEPVYRERGFVAWTDYRVSRQVMDPNFAYYRMRFRDDTWAQNLTALYTARFRGEIARPPRTLVAQQQVVNNIQTKNVVNNRVTNNINITNIQNVSVLAPITKINNTRITALASLAKEGAAAPAERVGVERQTIKLAPVARDERQRSMQQVEQVRHLVQQRQQNEAKAVQSGASRATDRPHTAKLELPRTTRPAPAGDATRPPQPGRPAAGTANRGTPPPPPAAARRQEERPGREPGDRGATQPPPRDRDATRPTPPVREPGAKQPPPSDPRDRDATRPMPDRDANRPTPPPTTPPRDRDATRPMPDRDATRPTPGKEPERQPPPVRRPEDPTRPPPIRDPRNNAKPDPDRDPRDTQRPAAGDRRDPTNPPPVRRDKPGTDPTDRPMPPTRERDDKRDVQPNKPMNNNPPGGARPGPMPPTDNKDRDKALDDKERKDKEKKDKDDK